MKRWIPSLIIGLVAVLLVGCSSDDKEAGQPADASQIAGVDGGETGAEEEEPQDGLPFNLKRDSESVEGDWLMYSCEEQHEHFLGIIVFQPYEQVEEVEGEEKKIVFLPAMIHPAPEGSEFAIIDAHGTADAVSVDLTIDKKPTQFTGRLKNGVIWGTFLSDDGNCKPARLVRPHKSLEEPPEDSLIDGIVALSKIIDSGSDPDALRQFLAEHTESPMAARAQLALVSQCQPHRVPQEQVEQLFAEIESTGALWGDRLAELSLLNGLVQFCQTYYLPDVSTALVEKLKTKFDHEYWHVRESSIFDEVTRQIELARAIERVEQAAEEEIPGVLEELQPVLKEQRFNPVFCYRIIEALTERAQWQAALPFLSKLVAIPQAESSLMDFWSHYGVTPKTPTSLYETAWREVHGSDEGRKANTLEAYRQLLTTFEVEPLPAEATETPVQNVLVEVFTGATCGPCAAADMACAVVRDAAPEGRVVFLQYHLHIPGPDPMATDDARPRFFYYALNGTPAVHVNGKGLTHAAGLPIATARAVSELRNEVARELGYQAAATIELTCEPGDAGKTSYNASVTAESSISDRWRLHVVLAEEQIQYNGGNGVPFHDMVVRKILSKADGAAPQGGKLGLAGAFSVDELKQAQARALDEFEKKTENEYTFPERPLDFRNLHLVAFIQDTRSRRVIQVTSVPIPGTAADAD